MGKTTQRNRTQMKFKCGNPLWNAPNENHIKRFIQNARLTHTDERMDGNNISEN